MIDLWTFQELGYVVKMLGNEHSFEEIVSVCTNLFYFLGFAYNGVRVLILGISFPLEHNSVMFRNNRIVGGRFESGDQLRDWRLDVDNMSYEELLKLCDRIGYVSTGLKDDEIGRSVAKMKLSNSGEFSKYSSSQVDKKCSICQEEYESEDEVGKLNCGHGYHLMCIKRWLSEKNACPVCKTGVSSRSPP